MEIKTDPLMVSISQSGLEVYGHVSCVENHKLNITFCSVGQPIVGSVMKCRKFPKKYKVIRFRILDK